MYTKLISNKDFLWNPGNREALQVVRAVKNLSRQKKQEGREFDQWVGKIRRRRAWEPTPVFLPGEAWQAIVHRVAELDRPEAT